MPICVLYILITHCHVFSADIAQGKKVLSVAACPDTPHCSSSNLQLTSTPAAAASVPSPAALSPLLHSQASPLAAALNQLKAAVAASPIGAAATPGQNIGASIISLSSPQAVTALVNEALKGARSTQLATKFQAGAMSPGGNQLANPISPLVKSVGSVSPSPSIANGSSHLSVSPGPKIVTVSKLPSTMTTTNDQITSLLQSLQQQSSSPLLKPVTTSAASDPSSTQSASNRVM